MSLLTQDVQAELDGVLLGHGTPYRFESFTPLAAFEVRSDDIDLPGSHGTLAGRDLAGGRRVPISLVILGDSKAHALELLRTLQAAWRPRDADVDLLWREAGAQYLLRGRPRLVDPDLALLAQAVIRVTLRFQATDPFIYSPTEHLTGAIAPTPSVGRTYPRTYPWRYGARGAGGNMNVANNGTAPAPWRAVVGGPCSEPRLISPDGAIAYGGQLLDGETLLIDSRDRSVLLQGTASRYALLTEFRWFDLPPGETEVLFSTADGQGGVFLSWRDTWW